MLHLSVGRGSTVHINGVRIIAQTGMRISFPDRVESLTVDHADGEREIIVKKGREDDQ